MDGKWQWRGLENKKCGWREGTGRPTLTSFIRLGQICLDCRLKWCFHALALHLTFQCFGGGCCPTGKGWRGFKNNLLCIILHFLSQSCSWLSLVESPLAEVSTVLVPSKQNLKNYIKLIETLCTCCETYKTVENTRTTYSAVAWGKCHCSHPSQALFLLNVCLWEMFVSMFSFEQQLFYIKLSLSFHNFALNTLHVCTAYFKIPDKSMDSTLQNNAPYHLCHKDIPLFS